MTRWPSLKKVIGIWSVLTACAGVAFAGYLRSLPPDDLVMGNDLSFQVLIGFVVVGLPSFFFLLLFLFIGAIAKRWLVEPELVHGEAKNEL